MKKEFFSVIIPTYNRSSYLKQAIQSVLDQTYAKYEIIVIDDGSTDDTKKMIGSFNNDKIMYIKQNRRGVSAARNLGIEKSSGEFISFLDDDDLYTPQKLEVNLSHFSINPTLSMICSGFRFIDKYGNKTMRGDVYPDKPELNLHDVAMFTLIHTSSVVTRKSLIDKVGGFPVGQRISEDYYLWSKLLTLGKGLAINEILTHFRQHSGNTKLGSFELFKENKKIINNIMKNKEPSLKEKNFYIENLYRIISMNLEYKKRVFELFLFKKFYFFCNLLPMKFKGQYSQHFWL